MRLTLYTVCIALAGFIVGHSYHAPKLTYHGSNWTLEHVAMPVCPDDHKRTVYAPEADETDALTVTCQVQ